MSDTIARRAGLTATHRKGGVAKLQKEFFDAGSAQAWLNQIAGKRTKPKEAAANIKEALNASGFRHTIVHGFHALPAASQKQGGALPSTPSWMVLYFTDSSRSDLMWLAVRALVCLYLYRCFVADARQAGLKQRALAERPRWP